MPALLLALVAFLCVQPAPQPELLVYADGWARHCTGLQCEFYPPCAQEDSPGPCYWDARSRGNGQGTSFIVNARGVVTPVG